MKQATFLWKNARGIYFFRARIPKRFLEYFTSQEIKKSLQTDSYRLAVKLARVYRVELDKQMDKLEKGIYNATSAIIEGETTITLPNGKEQLIKAQIERELVAPNEDTAQHKEYLLRQLREEAEHVTKLAQDKALFEAKLEASSEAYKTPKQKESELRAISLSALVEEYAKNKVVKKKWQPDPENQTHKNGLIMLKKIVEIIGDKPTTELTKLDAIKIEEALPNFPARVKGETAARSTQTKYWDLFVDLIKFGKKKLYVETDITIDCDGIATTKQERKDSSYERFTNKELQQIFNGHVYQAQKKRGARSSYDYHFWLPLLAAYSGARLNELCQLQLTDIKQHDNVWYIDITDQDSEGKKVEEKSIKSDAGKRKVPIHSKLIELGFIEFVNQEREGNLKHMLFSSGLTYNEKAGKWGRNAGTWFNGEGEHKLGYKSQCGIPKDGKKVFHSFRKSFAANLIKHTYIERLAQIIGHEQEYKTTFIYVKEIDLPDLKEDIDKLNYDIDLSHVSYASFKKKSN